MAKFGHGGPGWSHQATRTYLPACVHAIVCRSRWKEKKKDIHGMKQWETMSAATLFSLVCKSAGRCTNERTAPPLAMPGTSHYL